MRWVVESAKQEDSSVGDVWRFTEPRPFSVDEIHRLAPAVDFKKSAIFAEWHGSHWQIAGLVDLGMESCSHRASVSLSDSAVSLCSNRQARPPNPDISRYLGIIEKMGGRFSRVFNDRAAPWRLRRDESWDFSGAAATAKKGSRRARGDATYGDALRRRVSCRRGAG